LTGPPTIKTHQLVLRPTLPSDVDPLHEIQSDPVAMAHTWCAPDRAATADWLCAYARRHPIDGFTPWTAVLRADGAVVGWGGMNVDPFDPRWGAEVAYFVHKGHWGRGLASEIVAASLAWAFGELGLDSVSAFARAQNAPSIRVLTKSGFRFTGFVPELDRNQFAISRADPR
jgi:ribosomal-protein-alanine N-acetyltransferase